MISATSRRYLQFNYCNGKPKYYFFVWKQGKNKQIEKRTPRQPHRGEVFLEGGWLGGWVLCRGRHEERGEGKAWIGVEDLVLGLHGQTPLRLPQMVDWRLTSTHSSCPSPTHPTSHPPPPTATSPLASPPATVTKLHLPSFIPTGSTNKIIDWRKRTAQN